MPNKQPILDCLHRKAAAGVPIIGTGAGTGLTAKAEAEGGADRIIAYATGSFRMAGRSSLAGRFAASNANRAVLRMMDELIPVAGARRYWAGSLYRILSATVSGFLRNWKRPAARGSRTSPGWADRPLWRGRRTSARWRPWEPALM